MGKKSISVVLLFIFFHAVQTSAQVLFTYGTHSVTKDEFLQAYNKNPDTTGNKAEKLKEYLDLYINFKLKLQDAYDEKVNTNADLKNEADNFKSQLTDNFINQQADASKLVHEAFVRSQKDILLQQVFVPFSTNGDSAAASDQIKKAYAQLKSGKSFDDVTQEYSTLQSTKDSKGVIGYITVFTLPYSIENIIYNLTSGAYSNIYKSKSGYHIFKNDGERPAIGRRKIQQLLFSTPSFYSAEQILKQKNTTDSVYKLLKKGDSFESFSPLFGKNYETYDPTSSMEIKIGEYNSDFENQVFMLQKPGDISEPFKTDFGYNIIKLVEAVPISKDENDVTNTAYLQSEVQKDGRLNAAKKNLVQKWLLEVNLKESKYNKQDLWKYTDSVLTNDNMVVAKYKNLTPETILFSFEKQKYTVADWITYLKTDRLLSAATDSDQYESFMHDFISVSCENYYRQYIEDFDPAIKDQLKEFNDANMLFYVMDKHVWSKASQDSVGLKNYFQKNSDNYKWNKSVAAIVVSGANKSEVYEVADKIKNDPLNWRSTVAAFGNSIYFDSSRFETDQLPVKQTVTMQKDFQTVPEQNEAGDAYTFMRITGVFMQPENRNYDDAKGLVINDYQEQLEKEWVSELKKKYPVKVNDKVFNNIK